VDYRGFGKRAHFGEIYWAHAKFRSHSTLDENGNRKEIRVSVVGEQKKQRYLSSFLEEAKRGDVIVMNQGLHYINDSPIQANLLQEYTQIQTLLASARSRGVHLLWRETNAAHFNTTHGYYVKGVTTEPVECAPSSMLDPESSRNRSHGLLIPFMQSMDIPILEIWEATFLMPEWCHVAEGKDCLHYLQPGATAYFTEALLKHVENHV